MSESRRRRRSHKRKRSESCEKKDEKPTTTRSVSIISSCRRRSSKRSRSSSRTCQVWDLDSEVSDNEYLLCGVGRVGEIGKVSSIMIDYKTRKKVFFRNDWVTGGKEQLHIGAWFRFKAFPHSKDSLASEWEAFYIKLTSKDMDARRKADYERRKEELKEEEEIALADEFPDSAVERTGTGVLWYVGPRCSLLHDDHGDVDVFLYNSCFTSYNTNAREGLRIYYNAFYDRKYIAKHRIHVDWEASWVQPEYSDSSDSEKAGPSSRRSRQVRKVKEKSKTRDRSDSSDRQPSSETRNSKLKSPPARYKEKSKSRDSSSTSSDWTDRGSPDGRNLNVKSPPAKRSSKAKSPASKDSSKSPESARSEQNSETVSSPVNRNRSSSSSNRSSSDESENDGERRSTPCSKSGSEDEKDKMDLMEKDLSDKDDDSRSGSDKSEDGKRIKEDDSIDTADSGVENPATPEENDILTCIDDQAGEL